jgi:hypothetical protein
MTTEPTAGKTPARLFWAVAAIFAVVNGRGGNMRRRLIPLLLLLLLPPITHCSGGAPAGAPSMSAQEEPVRVIVKNEGFYDATIYLLRGTERRRLGNVPGNTTHTFTLQRNLVFGITDLRFIVDWIGRRGGATSETIAAQAGDEIQLVIR